MTVCLIHNLCIVCDLEDNNILREGYNNQPNMCLFSTNASCCYNHYFNGSVCTPCELGTFGHNCSSSCPSNSYGKYCNEYCGNCSICDAKIGCLDGKISFSRPIILTDMQVMPEKPSTPSDGSLNTHAYFTNNNITTSNLRRELTTPSSMVISSATTLQVPIIISKADSPFSNNVVVIGILCIGGFLCLLLTILVIQCCVRLYIQKRKLRKRVSVMLPDKDEEVYDEIKETGTFGSIRRYDGISEERQKSGKYFPLKESPKKKCQPYQHLVEPTRYQEIEDIKSVSVKSSISESSAENSNGLNNSKYLEPKIESQQHSYVELTETTSSKMQMQPDKERSEDTFQMGNEGSRSSSQYDDTVNNSVMASADENLKETVKQNNDTYLDVVNAGDNTYLDVSVS